jgi:hypothetical protein
MSRAQNDRELTSTNVSKRSEKDGGHSIGMLPDRTTRELSILVAAPLGGEGKVVQLDLKKGDRVLFGK